MMEPVATTLEDCDGEGEGRLSELHPRYLALLLF